MTNNNTTTMTQAAALRWLIDNANNAPAEVVEAAEKLYTAKTKKYDRTKTESKAARLNATLMPIVVELIENNPNTLINATWLNDHINHAEVRSPQKARYLADMAIKNGLIEKYTYKGRVYYCLPGMAPKAE